MEKAEQIEMFQELPTTLKTEISNLSRHVTVRTRHRVENREDTGRIVR